MAYLINAHCDRHFRWFDSGDIQGPAHLDQIIAVCKLTAHIHHWLPTQERGLATLRAPDIPPNLTMRLSAPFVDVSIVGHRSGLPTSYTSTRTDPVGYQCPAEWDDELPHRCGSCRACWDADIPDVVYKLKPRGKTKTGVPTEN
jgi:hypothetical protein